MSGGKRLSTRPREKWKTSSVVLVVLGLFLLSFILCMIVTFWVKDAVPDTLIENVLDGSKWEAGALAFIKVAKVVAGKGAGESEGT